MAHEQIIRNGLIVENRFSFLDNPTVYVSGITNSGPLVDREHIVSESAIKSTIESITLDDLSGVSLGTVVADDIIYYNGTDWVATGLSYLNDAYSKVEADARFVNLSGGTITGDLDIQGNLSAETLYITNDITLGGTVDGVDIAVFRTDFDNRSLSGNTDVTLGGTALASDQLLQYNGSQWINVDASSVVVDAYTKSEADTKFVYTTGDTMTGTLIINPVSGNAIETTGSVNIQGDLYVSGTTVSVDVENMSISDNLLLLNSGETGAGVTRDTAGLLVDRGTSSAVTLIFEESTFTIRAGETPSSVIDNTIDTSSTLKLSFIADAKNLGATTNYGIMYQDVLPNGVALLNNSTTITYNSGNLNLNGGNITMNGTETVDGVDISVFKSDYDTFTGTTYVNRTLNQISDVNVSGAIDDNIIVLSAGTWVATGISYIAGDFYTKSESDLRFVDVDGDIMTGNLTLPSLTATTSIVLNDYTVTDILDEDTLVSDSATALATQQSIKAYIDTEFSTRTLTGNTDVTVTAAAYQDVLYYSAGTWVNGDLNDLMDNEYVNVDGDTMTGDLTITPLSGTGNRLVFVEPDGTLQESEEFVYKTTNSSLGAGVNPTDTFSTSICKGVTWDYVIDNGTQMRAGTITAVWDGTLIDWNEVSTPDIGGTITNSDLSFSVDINGGNVRLVATIGSGTWSVDTSRQMI